MTKRLAICLGLTKLDPGAYGGWPGDCPGCDRDAARFATLCHDVGFDGVAVLINEAASIPFIKPAFLAAAASLADGDLLVLYCSGHGGQQYDISGDEDDRMDETLCWWGGEVGDDAIAAYLRKLASGVRVLFVTDTCNSGSNFRSQRRAKQSTPMKVVRKPRGFKGSLLHFGGCEDGRSSYGTDQGGIFTIALLDALSRARKPLSYREWFRRARARMLITHQEPVLSEWGSESFSTEEVLT